MANQNAERQFFFHLGLPKTASTFLQVIAFPKLESIEYYRKRKFKYFKSLAETSKAPKLLFTTESDRGFEKKLKAITAIFPKAKIILVFRRQDKWILSKYKYYIRKHGHLKFDDFFDLENDLGFWKKEELYFMKYVDLVKQYTASPPLVLTFEELKTDHQAFIKRITNFLEIPFPSKPVTNRIVKKAFSNKQIILLRRFNNWYRYKELKTQIRFINKVHYKYREFLLHIVAFFLGFVPDSMIKNQELVPADTLQRIQSFYHEDWTNICDQS